MSAPGHPQCQCAHPYYCRCQFSRWGVPIHAAPPTLHLSQYYPSTQYSATATYPTTHTPISASNFASATAPTVTSSVVGVGPSLETQSSSEVVPNPRYAAIEKVVGKVKNKADRRVMALNVWHFVTALSNDNDIRFFIFSRQFPFANG